jgi:hypothetical protein
MRWLCTDGLRDNKNITGHWQERPRLPMCGVRWCLLKELYE